MHDTAPREDPPDPVIQASFDATDLRVIDAAQADDDHEPTDDE